MNRRQAALCVLLVACAPDAKPEAKKVQNSQVEPAQSPIPVASAVPVFRGPVLNLPGAVLPGSSPAAPPTRALAGQRFTLAQGDVMHMDFGCGARASVTGPALVAVSARSDQGLLVSHGLVRVELPPGAGKPGPACWVASPALRMDLPRAARFALSAYQNGRSKIAVVSGRVTVMTAPTQDSGATDPDNQVIEAGRMLETDLTPTAPLVTSSGPATLEAALGLLGSASTRHETSAHEKLGARLQVSLQGLYLRTMGELAKARALDDRHRVLAAAGDKQAMAVQREIAEQAAATFRARRSLEGALSRLEAARLREPPQSVPDPVLARAAEVLR